MFPAVLFSVGNSYVFYSTDRRKAEHLDGLQRSKNGSPANIDLLLTSRLSTCLKARVLFHQRFLHHHTIQILHLFSPTRRHGIVEYPNSFSHVHTVLRPFTWAKLSKNRTTIAL